MAITNWKVAVLLVTFKNSTGVHRRTLPFYNDMFLKTGTGGLVDYWESVSFGKINLTGSELFTWREFPGTDQQFRDQLDGKGRGERSKVLIDLFQHVDFRKFNSVIIIPDMNVADAGAAGAGGVFTLTGSPKVTYNLNIPVVLSNFDLLGKDVAHANFFAHEMGHNFGLGHSYNVEEGLGNSWVQPGEYNDPWDVMGSTNPYGPSFMFSDSKYTAAGIALHALNLNRLGWLNEVRIKSFTSTADGRANGLPDEIFTLEPLYNFDTPIGFPAARINFNDADTGTAQSYWIELRMNTNWDRKATEPMLLIRRVVSGNSYLLSSNKTAKRFGWKQGEVFIDERNNIRIEIDLLTFQPVAKAVIRFGSFVAKPASIGALGKDIQAAGIALTNLDSQIRPELVVFAVENLNGENKAFCRVVSNLNNEGQSLAIGTDQLIPSWGQHENQRGDITFAAIGGNPRPDAVILYADNPSGGNEAFMRIGTDMLQSGSATWGIGIALPRKMAGRTLGAAIASARMDGNNTPDLVAVFADLPAYGKPWLYYRFAKNFNAAGNADTPWSDAINLPAWSGYNMAGIGAAVADLRTINKRDLVVFALDRTDGVSKGYYTIGRGLDSNGIVQEGWTEWISVPGTFANDCSDVSIELSRDFGSSPVAFSMLILSSEKPTPTGNYAGMIRIMKRLKM